MANSATASTSTNSLRCSYKRHKKCSIEPWTGIEQKERIERKAANKIEHQYFHNNEG
jgi:hypothetical protein